jgi:hypothetical protein
MSVSDRRAPYRVRSFAVLCTFRYGGRVYEAGGVFDARRDVPRHRLDKLWREGCIGTLEGDACAVEQPEEVIEEAPILEEEEEELEVETPEYGENHLD